MAHKVSANKKKDHKDHKKGSKLATLKSALFGATQKKKTASPATSRPSASKAEKVGTKDLHKKGKSAAAPSAPSPAKKASEVPATASKGKSPGKSPANHAATAAAAALARAKPGKAGKPEFALGLGSGRVTYDSNGEAVCREVACEGLATSAGYCRMHYIKNWKKIKRKEVILKEGKLNQYIEELVAKYPDKYIEAIRQDLANDKDFAKVIYDLDLDESVDDFSDVEGESIDSVIGEIKRDFDDEGEGF